MSENKTLGDGVWYFDYEIDRTNDEILDRLKRKALDYVNVNGHKIVKVQIWTEE